jgi:hypothetical protein
MGNMGEEKQKEEGAVIKERGRENQKKMGVVGLK